MYNITVNGQPFGTEADAETPLLWVLRDEAHLKGTKFGCGIGMCGACTVHVGGRATRSCITPVGAVESYPEVDILIDSLRRQGVKGVHLMPLMLVAGDHAINDMASDEEDSWKTLFNAAGITATPWLSGLGENPAVRAMFVAHLQQALNNAMEKAA